MRQPAVKAKAAARPPKARVKGDVVPLDYTLRLMDRIGPTALAKAIGTSPGTLHKARNAGAITKSLEVAARGVWSEQGFEAVEEVVGAPAPRTADLGAAIPSPTSEGVALLLIQVPRERAGMLQRAAETLGAIIISHD